jgi:hypothetical protein
MGTLGADGGSMMAPADAPCKRARDRSLHGIQAHRRTASMNGLWPGT